MHAIDAAVSRRSDSLAMQAQAAYDAAVAADDRRGELVSDTLDKLRAVDDCVLSAVLDDVDGYTALTELLERFA